MIGATMYEWQIKDVHIRIVRPKYWRISNLPFLRINKVKDYEPEKK